MSEASNTYRIGVKGITCQHCVKAITQAIHARDAAAEVTVDLPAGQVEVHTALSREAVVLAIEDEGYEVLS